MSSSLLLATLASLEKSISREQRKKGFTVTLKMALGPQPVKLAIVGRP